MRSERELIQARILLAKAAGALGSVREEYTTAGELADAIDDFLGLPRMSARVAAIIAKIEVRPRLETTAELVSRVVPETSRKWLPWKLSPDSDPAERWILVSAENDEIEHPDGAKYDTEAQAWIACERESK